MNSQIALAKSLGKRMKKRFSSIDLVRDFVQDKQIRIIRSYDLYFTWFCFYQVCSIFYDIIRGFIFFNKNGSYLFQYGKVDFMINNVLFDLMMNF